MSIEILSIGNELLSGHTINTNASTISQKLLSHGFTVSRVTYLPDEPDLLKKGIEEAMARSRFLITSGGLGPTGDDLTRDIVSEIYHTTLYTDEAIKKDLIERFGSNLPTLEDQARIPKGCTVIRNPLGTAPGFILEGKADIMVLPGVPSQMEVMLDVVAAHLERHVKEKHAIETLYLALLSEQAVDPTLRTLEKQHPGVQIGICPGAGILSVYVHGDTPKTLREIRDAVADQFSTHVYSTTNKRIEVALHEWMVEHQKTFAAGESCTGGHLAATLTQHAGASDYFLGSVVSYSNHLKETALGVTALKEKGAVSQETVLQMAEGVKKLTGADYIITTSGIAGPTGGTPEKPVGTVWAAIQTPEITFSGLVPFKRSAGTRSLIIEYSTTFLLASLYRYLKYDIEPFA